VWQALRAELHPLGIEIVTVGIDAAGPEACRPFIEAAEPTHPSLVDTTHRMSELFGVINIPNGVWIDEQGMITRPVEQASPRPPSDASPFQPMEGLPDHMNEVLDEASRIKVDGRYVEMLRDWAEHGAASRYALSPDEVVERSRPRDRANAEGQANLELGAALWARGDQQGAERHWREAHRLDPMNFTAKRQAWSLAVPDAGDFARYWQGPLPGREDEWPYDTDWLSEVRGFGAEHYYPPIDP
jgi:hypothetical protein